MGEGFKKIEPIAVGEESRYSKEARTEGDDARKFPAGLRGFSGMLVGKVVSADSEKGVLVLDTTSVKHVWENNKAENPESAKGKVLTINGVFGKFLDVLLTVKKGDAVEVEAKHDRGDALQFPGEWLKKVD